MRPFAAARTAVVRRDDLDVLHLPLSVRALVLDSYVRKMNVAVDDRKISTRSPFRHISGGGICIALGASAVAIEVAQEALVVALQLVGERDAPHGRTAAVQTQLPSDDSLSLCCEVDACS